MELATQADKREKDAPMKATTHSHGTIHNALEKIKRNHAEQRRDRETMRAQVECSDVGS